MYYVSEGRRKRALDCSASTVNAANLLEEGDVSLYVGIPVCPTRCTYCSFVSRSIGKRTELSEYLRLAEDGSRQPQGRGGKGVKNYNITAKTGKIAGVRVVSEEDDIMLIENSGIIIRMPAADINVYKRDTQGVIVMRVEPGNHVISIERLERVEEEPAAQE